MRAMLYSSWASSTWSLPSAEWAWSAKMSRITAVRSITGTPERRLQVALLARGELVVAGDEVGVAGGDLLLQLVEPAAAEVAVGVGLGALLGGLARGRDAGGAQQLLELGQRLAVGSPPSTMPIASARWRARGFETPAPLPA